MSPGNYLFAYQSRKVTTEYINTPRPPERFYIEFIFFYEIKDEAVALVYSVIFLCKTGKYSVMLWKFTGKIKKHY